MSRRRPVADRIAGAAARPAAGALSSEARDIGVNQVLVQRPGDALPPLRRT